MRRAPRFANHAALVVATRNDHVERVHQGSIAVVDHTGRLIAYAGDPAAYTFSRSTLKPFQALPFVCDGGLSHFSFSEEEAALLCASHRGEDVHIRVVDGMLHKIGCAEHDLDCGAHVPDIYSESHLPPESLHFDQRHNNCSGKHTGFLGFCKMHDLDLKDYLDPKHPLQHRIVQTLEGLSQLPKARLWFGVDGCNAPNIGMPLNRLAFIWAQFANAKPSQKKEEEAMHTLCTAMMHHPLLFSGTASGDYELSLAGAGAWVAKSGADGVRTIGVRSRSIGIAIKIADGNLPAAYCASLSVLQQLGLLEKDLPPALQAFSNPLLRNRKGNQVGEEKACFTLQFL